MISNYLKVIFRNLKKHKLFGITNIAGLSIGILCCLMIMIYVNHELSYDKWNPNADRIVRTYSDINFGGNLMKMAVSGSVIAPESADALPEIEAWCRIRDYGSYLTKIDGTDQMNIEVEEALHADSTFFKLFPSKLLEGDPERCLAEPNKVVLSESLAEILLDAEDPLVGQILLLDNR
ncbi:MAG: ABC transporter permease, partial [Saprospiraceae bacterium]|nr:ABC transporter permease [Saprospiraceae bacterium]